jgi:hypothetical protein
MCLAVSAKSLGENCTINIFRFPRRSPRAERRRDRDRGRGENGGWETDVVKDEPKEEADYDEYSGYGQVKQEPEDRKPMRLVDHGDYDDGEY